MNDPTLTKLLRQADDAAPPPPLVAGLAKDVRVRAATRSRHQLIAASLAFPVVLAGLVVAVQWYGWRQHQHDFARSTRPAEVKNAAAANDALLIVESNRLAAEAASHESTANSLDGLRRRRERATRARELLASADADPVARERESAALALLDHGDRLRRDLKQVDAALAAYRRTIELFPDSRWAAVAKQRIDQFKPDARGPAAGASLS
jgi:hypothetical protein